MAINLTRGDSRPLLIGLTVFALLGWGLFIYAELDKADNQHGARREILALSAIQGGLNIQLADWEQAAGSLADLQAKQTVWKLSLKGSVLRLGWGNLPHGTHSRSRPLADAALAGDGGRLRRPGQSGAVHRSLRGWARPGGGRLCSGRAQTDRSAGLCAG